MEAMAAEEVTQVLLITAIGLAQVVRVAMAVAVPALASAQEVPRVAQVVLVAQDIPTHPGTLNTKAMMALQAAQALKLPTWVVYIIIAPTSN